MAKNQTFIEEEIRKLESEKIFLERKLSEDLTDYEIEDLDGRIFDIENEIYLLEEELDGY